MRDIRSLQSAAAATALVLLALSSWRLAYAYTDWAALLLLPLFGALMTGFWPVTLDPWRARLHLALRADSPLGRILTGQIRAICLAAGFSGVAVLLLAWKALSATPAEAAILTGAFFLTACAFTTGQALLLRHLHQPFARSAATSLVTWVAALPVTLVLAWSTWNSTRVPGAFLEAGLKEAIAIGITQLPRQDGWIARLLSIPQGYESAKLWLVVQLRDYPVVGALFSIDAALFAFVLCRAAVIATQFTLTHVSKADD